MASAPPGLCLLSFIMSSTARASSGGFGIADGSAAGSLSLRQNVTRMHAQEGKGRSAGIPHVLAYGKLVKHDVRHGSAKMSEKLRFAPAPFCWRQSGIDSHTDRGKPTPRIEPVLRPRPQPCDTQRRCFPGSTPATIPRHMVAWRSSPVHPLLYSDFQKYCIHLQANKGPAHQSSSRNTEEAKAAHRERLSLTFSRRSCSDT